jgi:hypothetical protein
MVKAKAKKEAFFTTLRVDSIIEQYKCVDGGDVLAEAYGAVKADLSAVPPENVPGLNVSAAIRNHVGY